jgi:hypothetical protein
VASEDSTRRRDFLAGMTDRFAVSSYERSSSQALVGADGLESAIIDGRLSHEFRERGTGHAAGPHRYRQPVISSSDVPRREVEQEGDRTGWWRQFEVDLEIHKDKADFAWWGRYGLS